MKKMRRCLEQPALLGTEMPPKRLSWKLLGAQDGSPNGKKLIQNGFQEEAWINVDFDTDVGLVWSRNSVPLGAREGQKTLKNTRFFEDF